MTENFFQVNVKYKADSENPKNTKQDKGQKKKKTEKKIL
jgi:hypothetical protein